MYYCKDFSKLSVLSLYEGELLGVVDKLYFDKSLKKLCAVDLINEEGARLILNTKNIYKVGKNAITVKNNQALTFISDTENYCIAPISSKAYSINGEFLGVVSEVSINEKYLSEKVVLDNGELLDVNLIATCGKNTLIFYNKENKVNVKQFIPRTPKIFKKKTVEVVRTMPVENGVELKVEKQPIMQNDDFLLGRVCIKDIFNFNNELLIKAHTIINSKNLKEIKKFGKLRELMLYTV